MNDFVIVNGIKKNISYQRCVRCISDVTCPGISFDKNGVCNFCALHDKWARMYPNDARGEIHLQTMIQKMKRDGAGKKYDCAVFENKESVDDDLNGRWHNEFKSKELYAKGLGLIYYKKTLGGTVLEYELSDIYEMSDLEKKFSEQKN